MSGGSNLTDMSAIQEPTIIIIIKATQIWPPEQKACILNPKRLFTKPSKEQVH